MSGLKTPPEKLKSIADYWRTRPEVHDADICARFRVCCKTAKKVRESIWSDENPRPIIQKPTRFDALRRRLFLLLRERPQAKLDELAEELGASREWIRSNAPSGHFSGHRRGRAKKNEATTSNRKTERSYSIRRDGLRIFKRPND